MQRRVAVLGSMHMDIKVSASRLPLLGETLIGGDLSRSPGGKGLNQAAACARAGGCVSMLGAVGADLDGADMRAFLERGGVGVEGIVTVPGLPSGASVVIQSGVDYHAVVASHVNAALSESMFAHWADTLAAADWLVLQNEIPEHINVIAAAAVRARGGRVVLNAAPARALLQALAGYVDILVVNAVEAQAMEGGVVGDLASASRAAAALAARHGCLAVVTAGRDGVAWHGPDGARGALPGTKVDAVSTHGAGDVLIGQMVAELARGAAIADALAAGNDTAARFVATAH